MENSNKCSAHYSMLGLFKSYLLHQSVEGMPVYILTFYIDEEDRKNKDLILIPDPDFTVRCVPLTSHRSLHQPHSHISPDTERRTTAYSRG